MSSRLPSYVVFEHVHMLYMHDRLEESRTDDCQFEVTRDNVDTCGDLGGPHATGYSYDMIRCGGWRAQMMGSYGVMVVGDDNDDAGRIKPILQFIM